MPKQVTAQSIPSIDSFQFVFDAEGNIAQLNVTFEVNYGEFGVFETIDILPHLKSPDEVKQAEALYKAVRRELERIYLG